MTNPFFETWDTPFGAPPFEAIKTEHFAPAYTQALEAHRKEVAAIAADPAAPSFDNTIAALERAGKALRRVDMVFSQLAGAATNDALQAIERDMAPIVARHWNDIFLNAPLFRRIDALYQKRGTLGLDPEAKRVLERYHLDFVRAGANLSDAQRARFAEIVERLAVLGTQFGQNVLGDEQDVVWQVWDIHPTEVARRLRTLSTANGTDITPDTSESAGALSATTRMAVSGELVGGWLCFESDREKRRLWPIPSGWEFLSDSELTNLCASASHAPERKPRVKQSPS